jgi:hypothetical protein
MKSWHLVLTILFCFSQSSFAQIGSDKSTIDSMAQRPGASRLETVLGQKFEVHSVKLPSRLVRYYVANNKIFCETWSGLNHPDLSEALGPNYNEYKAEFSKSRKKGARSHVVSTSTIYVERHGMMGNVKGKACVLSYMPANVSLEEIK